MMLEDGFEIIDWVRPLTEIFIDMAIKRELQGYWILDMLTNYMMMKETI
jgi:hypothetical protein